MTQHTHYGAADGLVRVYPADAAALRPAPGLVWAHGFWTGIDTPSARWLYLATGTLALGVAVSRYVAQRPSDLPPDKPV